MLNGTTHTNQHRNRGPWYPCTAKRLVLKWLEHTIDTKQIANKYFECNECYQKNVKKKNIHCYLKKNSKSELETFFML